MQVELWGASLTSDFALPERPVAWVLLLLYGLILALAIYYLRPERPSRRLRRWGGITALALAAVFTRHLFSIDFYSESQLPPLFLAQNPEVSLAPFGFLPMLLAGAWFGPLAALFVGFVDGVSRAVGQSQQILDPFQMALVALFAALLLRQRFSGWLYRLLRQPIVVGLLAATLLDFFIGLGSFAYARPDASGLAALDLALSTSYAFLVPLLLEGALGGGWLMLIRAGVPQLAPETAPVPAPFNDSLTKRLLATFLLFAVLLNFVILIIGFHLAVGISTRLAVQQLASDANAVAVRIPEFRNDRQHLLDLASDEMARVSPESEEVTALLERVFRWDALYRRVMLADADGAVQAVYPSDGGQITLANHELAAVTQAVNTRAPSISPAHVLDDGLATISYVVPVGDEQDQPAAVLIGHVPAASLEELVTGLQGTLGAGRGFIVDERNHIIGHPEPASLMVSWTPPASTQQLDIETPNGAAFRQLRGSSNARELLYFQRGPGHPWTTVITLPYEVILDQSAQIAGRLALVLSVAMVAIGGYLVFMGRSVTGPLSSLVRASQQIAAGKLNTPIDHRGPDEIGRLGKSFVQMQRALRDRLDEQALLLDVSRDVSRTMDIHQGMPTIMKGTLRGTGAACVRIVVLNPIRRKPLVFGEGPASSQMARFDRQILGILRERQELVLSTPQQVAAALSPDRPSARLPQALLAIPLVSKERFQGIFWVTYRQPRSFDEGALNFIRTLANQASVLVENARLYANAEGGRRRLAAVLASTSDAVIVTDQSDRILLLNPAMEQLLNVQAADVLMRSVQDVIDLRALVVPLMGGSRRSRKLEITVEEERVYSGSVSTIITTDGQLIGKVAVLHDITHLKEIDQMKSDFVATVSHDLRSPLTYMLGYASMLPLAGDLAPKQQEYVNKIVSGIEQMDRLVNDLLDLGRLEAGVQLVTSNVHISEVVESVVGQHEQAAHQAGTRLAVAMPPHLPTVRGEVSLIRQAVSNLVSNAIKYAPASEKITVGARLEDQNVIIWVRDRGPGIAPKDQFRLFEKFYRVEENGQNGKESKGTGLGLALVRSIAQRHGGRTWCESTLGEGSTFLISLPRTGA